MNQRGISLVQVTIAAALAAGIGLFLARMADNASKSASGFRQKMAYNMMKREIEDTMGDEVSCFNTLTANADRITDPQPVLGSITQINFFNRAVQPDGGNITLYETTNGALYEGLRIESIALVDNMIGEAAVPGTEYLRLTIKSGRSDLSTTNANRGFYVGVRDMFIKLHTVYDGANLVSCSSSRVVETVKQICNGYGAVYDEETKRCDIIGIDGLTTDCGSRGGVRRIQIVYDPDGGRRYDAECMSP